MNLQLYRLCLSFYFNFSNFLLGRLNSRSSENLQKKTCKIVNDCHSHVSGNLQSKLQNSNQAGLLKEKKLVKIAFFFSLFLFFGSHSWTSLADSICDCEKIIKTKRCDNPDCIKVCNLQDSLTDINFHLAEICLGKGNQAFNFKKADVKATQIEFLIKQAKERIEEIEEKSKELLKKNCPYCQLLSKISAHFKVEPQKKNCPDQYLKTHYYKNSKRMDLQKGACNKAKIFSYFESYVRDLVSGKNVVSRKLWTACPDPCSFDVSYSVKIDEEQCKGEFDARVDCTHGVDKSFFGIPIYDLEINYTGSLKCKESSQA